MGAAQHSTAPHNSHSPMGHGRLKPPRPASPEPTDQKHQQSRAAAAPASTSTYGELVFAAQVSVVFLVAVSGCPPARRADVRQAQQWAPHDARCSQHSLVDQTGAEAG